MSSRESDIEYMAAHADGWRDCLLAIKIAAEEGTLVDKFLDGKLPRGLQYDGVSNMIDEGNPNV